MSIEPVFGADRRTEKVPSRFISGSGVFSHTNATQTLPSSFACPISALFDSLTRFSKYARCFKSLIAFLL